MHLQYKPHLAAFGSSLFSILITMSACSGLKQTPVAKNIIENCNELGNSYENQSKRKDIVKSCISQAKIQSKSKSNEKPQNTMIPKNSSSKSSSSLTGESLYIHCRLNQSNINEWRRIQSERLGPAVALKNQFGTDDPRSIKAQQNYDAATKQLGQLIPAEFQANVDFEKAVLIFSRCNKKDFGLAE